MAAYVTLATATNETESPERRANERAEVALFGRCMLPNGAERPCQVVEVSPGDCKIVMAEKPKAGERVLAYLDHLGRIDGRVMRVHSDGFSMSIDGTSRRREKLAARIEWICQSYEYGRDDGRRHVRLEPQNRNGEIKMPDGRAYKIEIIDISLSGAAVRCNVRPALGSKVSLSGMNGSVVRHFDEGIAMEFDRLQQDVSI